MVSWILIQQWTLVALNDLEEAVYSGSNPTGAILRLMMLLVVARDY